MRPTLRQLEYAVAVAEHRHFARAARACRVSQPGLSAQIRELEEALGTLLFERGSRGVHLTPAGKRVVEGARALLAAADELVDDARGAGRPLSGTLRMGAIPTIAPYLLPRVLSEIREAFPALRLLLAEARGSELLDRLRAGLLDLVLFSDDIQGEDIQLFQLYDEALVLAAPAGHALLTRKRAPEEKDLEGERLLALESGHSLGDHVRRVLRESGALEPYDVRGSGLATLLQMVAAGEGLTLLPELAVDVEVREGTGLGARAFRRPGPTRPVSLAWRSSAPRGTEYALLGEQLRASARRAGLRSIGDARARLPGDPS